MLLLDLMSFIYKPELHFNPNIWNVMHVCYPAPLLVLFKVQAASKQCVVIDSSVFYGLESHVTKVKGLPIMQRYIKIRSAFPFTLVLI